MPYNGKRPAQKLRALCRSGGALAPRGTRKRWDSKNEKWVDASTPSESQADIFLKGQSASAGLTDTLKRERARVEARKQRRRDRKGHAR